MYDQIVPDITLKNVVLLAAKIDRPEPHKLTNLGVNFRIDFYEHEGAPGFTLVLGVRVSYLVEEQDDPTTFLEINYEGEFDRNTEKTGCLDRFIAANMLHPYLRSLATSCLSELNIDSSQFPLSVPIQAVVDLVETQN